MKKTLKSPENGNSRFMKYKGKPVNKLNKRSRNELASSKAQSSESYSSLASISKSTRNFFGSLVQSTSSGDDPVNLSPIIPSDMKS